MKIGLWKRRRNEPVSRMRHAESEEQEKVMMLRVHLTSSVIFKVCIYA